MLEAIQSFITSAGLLFFGAVGWVLIFLLPARVLQKRHGYSVWLFAWSVVPFVLALAAQFVVIAGFALFPLLLPLTLLWALALSTPKNFVGG